MPAWFSLHDCTTSCLSLCSPAGSSCCSSPPRRRQIPPALAVVARDRGPCRLGRRDDRRHAWRAGQRGARPAVDRRVQHLLQRHLPAVGHPHAAPVDALSGHGRARHGEYVFLVLCATLGMMFMATGTDLITIFVGLETMAIAFYILAGLLKPDRRSNEAGVKYFLLGRSPSASCSTGSRSLRDVGDDEPARPRHGGRQPRARPLARPRAHPGRRRRRLQDRGGPVPHVGTGRLRGRADAHHRVPLGGIEGGLFRHAAADLPGGLPSLSGDWTLLFYVLSS